MKRTLYALKIDICPRGSFIPIVSHVFYGETEEQVESSLRGHMGHDVFLAECVTSGTYDDNKYSVVKRLAKKEMENGR